MLPFPHSHTSPHTPWGRLTETWLPYKWRQQPVQPPPNTPPQSHTFIHQWHRQWRQGGLVKGLAQGHNSNMNSWKGGMETRNIPQSTPVEQSIDYFKCQIEKTATKPILYSVHESYSQHLHLLESMSLVIYSERKPILHKQVSTNKIYIRLMYDFLLLFS